MQLAVLDRHLTAPPAAPADGDRYIVASGATGAWAGWDLNVAYWVDGAWMRLVPRPGWLAWVADEAAFVGWDGAAWQAARAAGLLLRRGLQLAHDADPTRRAVFDLAAIAAGTTRTYALPNISTELASLVGRADLRRRQDLRRRRSPPRAPSPASAPRPGTATYGVGTGATASGATKTVNLGTGGASGSNTVVNIGSATPGADGTTVINTPTVTFANGVTEVGMPQANLTALLLGLGGAVADAFNRLSINTPAVLLNHAGAGIEATVNKNAAGDDAAFAFKTGFSARALIGLLGDDDFRFKVSPDGSAYFNALLVDRTSGRVRLPAPLILDSLAATPVAPATNTLGLAARSWAGTGWLDVVRPNGQRFPLQPHIGINRVARWSPSNGTTVITEGMPRTVVGTVTTPGLATTNLSASMRRWKVTSAATVDSVAEERSGSWVCWRGNAAGLGGWTYTQRFLLAPLQATGMGFFGLYGSTAALATTLTLSAVVNCVGIGFQRGTHANWQLVSNDASGSPSLVDLGPSFPVNSTTNVLTLLIYAAANAASVWVRVTEEVSGAVAEIEITADLPAATQLLTPRSYLNNGATAAAVAYESTGVYIETDF